MYCRRSQEMSLSLARSRKLYLHLYINIIFKSVCQWHSIKCHHGRSRKPNENTLQFSCLISRYSYCGPDPCSTLASHRCTHTHIHKLKPCLLTWKLADLLLMKNGWGAWESSPFQVSREPWPCPVFHPGTFLRKVASLSESVGSRNATNRASCCQTPW